MARRVLSEASLEVVQAVDPWLAQAAADGRRVVVGVSGGPDSTALALACAHLMARGLVLDLCAVVVDHGLQPGSDEVAARTAAQLNARGLTVAVVPVTVDQVGGPEAAARRVRLAALRGVARGGISQGGWVLLGHTLDDQAESVLLGLARGSGPRSLAGMAALRDDLVRPLLKVRRATTVAACRDWGVDTWDDPHNSDSRFLRSQVRSRLLPVMDEVLGPGVVPALARTADLARADADALDVWAESVLSAALAPDGSLSVDVLQRGSSSPEEGQVPPAVISRVVRTWLTGRGWPAPQQAATAAVLALVTDWHGQREVAVPGGTVRRVRVGEGPRLVAEPGVSGEPAR